MKNPANSPSGLSPQRKKELAAKAILIDRYAVLSTTLAGSGHPSTATSIGHIVATLMYVQMRWDPSDPWNLAGDRLVLSEGHAVPIVYPAYGDLGGRVGPDKKRSRKLKLDEVRTLRQADSVLDGHPNPALGFPFFDAATGSLGMGASVGAGLGLAARLDGTGRRVYVIIGDGESREGQIWEAVDFIAEKNLTNVTLIFNANGQAQSEPVAGQQSYQTLAAKLKAYGLEPLVIDGHDIDEVYAALSRVGKDKPVAIVARTVKGWGVSALRNGNWHGKPLPKADLAQADADLDAELAKGGLPDPTKVKLAPPKPAKKVAPARPKAVSLGDADFAKILGGHPLPAIRKLLGGFEKGKLATRRVYGVALAELGRKDKRVVALDGDVKNSTFAEYFAEMFPDRYFECRIAEQNMVSAAAGLAAAGKVPFVSTFGKFFARALDQIELAIISGANIKIVGSHSGTTLGADGPSQMSLPDIAYFRSFGHRNVALGEPATPGAVKVKPADAACPVFVPADAVATWKLVELMANHIGPCYMRTLRPDTPLLYKPAETFELGGHKVVRRGGGKGKRLVIASNGYTLFESLKAAEALAAKGVSATVVDCYTLPLNAAPVLKLAERNGGVILTVEDNYNGGLGSELAEAAAASGKVRVHAMAVRRIPKSGDTPEEMLAMSGLDAKSIAATASKLAGR
ncbi:MAG: Transketolase 2 [Phycisphaerae bacterium]|nr:Transketolase 2 [Phycisphaerae bacterium]